jgi:hypothetical protein
MANPNMPFGLRPVRHKSGAPYNGAFRKYFVPASDATALFIGDPVIMTGASNTVEVNGHAPGVLPVVTRHTAGANPITGVVVGVEAADRSDLQYRAASTARIVYVADDPDLIFHVRDNGAAAPAGTWVSSNANLAAGTGDTGFGVSKFVIAGATTPTNTAAAALRIVGLADMPTNELSQYAIWEVTINNHTFNAGIVGVGISA